MRFLVIGSEGPTFESRQETVRALEHRSLPLFAALMRLQSEGKVVAGGIPVGQRAVAFILEAASPEEADRRLRELPAWGTLQWEVTPLQSFEGRAAQEREFLAELKKGM